MSGFSVSSSCAPIAPFSLSYEEPDSYIKRFLSEHPNRRRDIEDNELLKKILQEACLITKGARAYQALCAYYDEPVQDKERVVFDNGMTLVHFAALGGQDSCFAEEDSFDVKGASVEHYLAMGGQVTLLKIVGSDKLFRPDEAGLSPLDYAFLHHQKEVVEWFAQRGDCQIACIMRDFLSSVNKEEKRIYTEVGVRILKLLDQRLCYAPLGEKIKKPIAGIYFLFSYVEMLLHREWNEPSNNLRFASIQEIMNQAVLKREEGDWTAVDSLAERVKQELLQKLSGIEKIFYINEQEAFEKRASSVLDEIGKIRSLSQSGYKRVNEGTRWKELGRGAFSTVYQVKDQKGCDRAIKVFNDCIYPSYERENQWHNYLLAVDLENKEHIVRKIGFLFDDMKPCMVMELYECDLYNFIFSDAYNHNCFAQVREIVRQILEALVFLHKIGIIHGDLKSKNVFVKPPLRCVVGDFDVAHRKGHLHEDYAPPEDLQTRWYRSPECVLHAQSLYGYEMDIWSLGCILAELVSKRVLFPCEEKELMATQQAYLGTYPNELLNKASPEKLRQWQALEVAQGKSPNLQAIVSQKRKRGEHKSREHFSDLYRNMLQLSPLERISSEEALKNPVFAPLEDRKEKK